MYLLLVGVMLANESDSLHHFEPEEGAHSAFILAAIVYAVIFGIIYFHKKFGKARQEPIDKFLAKRQAAGDQYYQLNEMNQSQRDRPQEVL